MTASSGTVISPGVASQILSQQSSMVKPDTGYVVLAFYENDWTVVAKVSARDGNAAVKAALADRSKFPSRVRSTDTFVAVPVRSWKPVKATEKVETTWEIEEKS